MNISSSHSISKFVPHIVIHWSLFKVEIESLHNSQQRETIYDKLTSFANLVRQWKSKEWAKFKLGCLLLIFIYSNSKFAVTCKNADLECRYIVTHTKETPEMSNITFVLLPFYPKKKKKYSNQMGILSTLESTTPDKTIRSASKWFILT